MTNKKVQTKSQNKLLFCKLCSYVATSYEELDHHYALAHEESDDIEEEIEIKFVDKKTYQKLLYQDYLRICKSKVCVIRREIDVENDKSEVRRLYKEYCSTCELKKFLIEELRQNGKI